MTADHPRSAPHVEPTAWVAPNAVHVATFSALVGRCLPEARTSHVIDESLLTDARMHGPATVASRIGQRLTELVAAGADVLCCTCLTIGDVAESSDAVVPVFRGDRPRARCTIQPGPRIGISGAKQ